MKSEQQVQDGIDKVQAGLLRTFDTAKEQFEKGYYDECSESLFSLMVNVAALEAAKRILEY